MLHYCSKRYKKIRSVCDGFNIAFTILSVASGVSSVGVLATIAGMPIALILEGISLGTAGVTIGANFLCQKLVQKSEKHEKIFMVALSKLNSINDLISKALEDSHISDGEYNTILKEYENYMELKKELKLPHINHKALKKELAPKVKIVPEAASILYRGGFPRAA